MTQYAVIIDGKTGAYGAVVPDCPGCAAMGDTVEEALLNITEALSQWVAWELSKGRRAPHARALEEVRGNAQVIDALDAGGTLMLVPLVLDTGRPAKANISLDAGLMAAIDEAANRAGVTRSAFLAAAARHRLATGT